MSRFIDYWSFNSTQLCVWEKESVCERVRRTHSPFDELDPRFHTSNFFFFQTFRFIFQHPGWSPTKEVRSVHARACVCRVECVCLNGVLLHVCDDRGVIFSVSAWDADVPWFSPFITSVWFVHIRTRLISPALSTRTRLLHCIIVVWWRHRAFVCFVFFRASAAPFVYSRLQTHVCLVVFCILCEIRAFSERL